MKRIEAYIYRALFLAPPTWGAIAVMLALGVTLVAFGNLDRVFWKMSAQGGSLPGLVLDVRSYRAPDLPYATFVPRVAFRDLEGTIRIMETRRSSVHYDLQAEQPVLVAWQPPEETVAIDLPFQRQTATSVIMSLLTALGLTAWLGGIWLLLRRVLRRGGETGLQLGQNE